MPVSNPINLVLVYAPKAVDVEDFKKIRQRVEAIAGNIRVYIQKDQIPGTALLEELAQYPTLVFSPMQMHAFYVNRGRIYAGRPMQKSEQLLRLELAGVPVPPWTSLDRAKRFDPDWWGEYVVVKPEISSAGRGVAIHKTSMLNDRSSRLQSFSRQGNNFVVQKLVRSKHSSKIRVQTLFDEVLYAGQFRFKKEVRFDTDADIQNYQKQFVSTTNKRELCYAEDVFALARQCFPAFDGVALLALDVMVDESGTTFFIEANPGGNTWHYSSTFAGQRLRSEGVYLEEQFSAFDRAGDLLAKRAQSEAV